jgi:hypothetical protein
VRSFIGIPFRVGRDDEWEARIVGPIRLPP